ETGMAVVKMGYRPLFLIGSETNKRDIKSLFPQFEYQYIDAHNIESLLQKLEPIRHEIAGVSTLVDSCFTIASQIAALLSIPGPDSVCTSLQDKAIVAELCHEYSFETFTLCHDVFKDKNKLNNILSEKSFVAKRRFKNITNDIRFLYTNED